MKQAFLFFITVTFLNSEVVKGQDKYTYPDTTLKSLDPVKGERAKSLVLDYIRILLKGDNIDSLVNICSIPFSWDRKVIIDNWDEFKVAQQAIVDQKGKDRKYHVDTIYVKAIRNEMLDNIIPLNVYYIAVKLKVTREGRERTKGVLFGVQISESPKIIGVSD